MMFQYRLDVVLAIGIGPTLSNDVGGSPTLFVWCGLVEISLLVQQSNGKLYTGGLITYFTNMKMNNK